MIKNTEYNVIDDRKIKDDSSRQDENSSSKTDDTTDLKDIVLDNGELPVIKQLDETSLKSTNFGLTFVHVSH